MLVACTLQDNVFNAFPKFTCKAQKLGKVAFKSLKKAQNLSAFTFFGAPTCPAFLKRLDLGQITFCFLLLPGI